MPHRFQTVLLSAALLVSSAVGVIATSGSALGNPPGHEGPDNNATATANPADGVLNQGSRTLDFDHGWKFQLVSTTGTTDPTGTYGNSSNPLAAAPDFDDSAWRDITLPHDWSIEQTPAATNSGSTGYFPGGLGWYRKTFTLPKSDTGKQISVDFDGVYQNSYVYLNGVMLGNHPYGYTAYSYDISDKAHTDGKTPNVLAVVVQNQAPSSRWYSGSGITRNVHLTVTDSVHVARDGVFVTTPELATTYPSQHNADVHVTTQVANDTPVDSTARVTTSVIDTSGKVVAKNLTSGFTVGTAASATATQDITVNHPHLWSTDDPYLYTLKTDISIGNKTLDSVTTTFGIRWLVFDPNSGISLNGQHLKLQGVDLHNDQGALGSVNNYDALYRQMSILKSEGVNSFRTSHNPPSPEMIDVCQRLGIVMMVEAFDSWGGNGKVANDYHLYFDQWSDYDITEMVNEAKNSPAVIMWSIGNEIPNFTSASSISVEQRLIADIKGIDASRPVVAGSNAYLSVPAPNSSAAQVLNNLDGLGLNYDTAQAVDGLHAAFPTKFFFYSESSSETSARGAYQDPQLLNTGENYVPGKRLTSSYENNFASWPWSDEYGLQIDRDRQWFAGQFIWSGFDYIGEPTPYSVFPVKTSSFGAIDTAGFSKDAYYEFQSQWTTDPMVHIVPMNWTDYQPGQDVTVEVYANEPSIELYLNGHSLGAKSFDTKTSTEGVTYLETTECTNDDKNYHSGACPGSYESPNGSSGHIHLTWQVPFQPGQLVAVARNAAGHQVARDEQDTAGAPATITLTPDKTVLTDDGKSLSYVTVNVVDSHGVTVPDASNAMTFSVTGAGTFVGADNGKEDDAEGYKSTTHNAYAGKVLAIVEAADDKTGPVTITATSPGLTPATTTIYTVDPKAHGKVGSEPVYTRAPLGGPVHLPSTVIEVYADGTTVAAPVRWHKTGSLPAGVSTIKGTVPGGSDAEAVVTVYKAGSVAGYSTVVPVGTRPGLPSQVTVIDTDGTTHPAAVTWAAVDPSAYAQEGSFSVTGKVAGTHLTALATVRVTTTFTADTNIARSTSPTHPSADASYAGSTSEVPAGMLDGNTTTGGWSNFYNKSATFVLPAVSSAHPSDWVSVGWPNTQRLSSVVAYFTINSNRVLPSSITASYWNGTGWTPVPNQQAVFATASNQPTTVTFDPVCTTAIRLDLTSPAPGTNTGFLQITELQVPSDQVGYNADATLSDLRVNGYTVSGFDPTTTSYTVSDAQAPVITATAADNGTVAIVEPATTPGTAIVTVTSEDRRTTATYSVTVTKPGHPHR